MFRSSCWLQRMSVVVVTILASSLATCCGAQTYRDRSPREVDRAPEERRRSPTLVRHPRIGPNRSRRQGRDPTSHEPAGRTFPVRIRSRRRRVCSWLYS